MIASIGLLGAALLLFAGPAAAQGPTLEQVLANGDRATGLPPGVTARPGRGHVPRW